MGLLTSSAVRELADAAALRRKRLVGGLVIATGALVLDACVVEPRWLARTTVELPHATGQNAPLRIAVVSDLHTSGLGFVERSAVAAVAEARPDLVVVTGDVVDDGNLPGARPVLAALVATKPRLGTWAVAGNWEHWRPPAVDSATFYADLGITLLDDDARPLDPTDASGPWIVGVDWEGSATRALAKVPRGAPVVLLVHAPGTFHELRTRAREGDHPITVLAGHTHGGQVRLPLLGALWLPPGSGAYAEGSFGDAQAALYVSRGIGTSIAPVRFFCRPELPIVTVRLAPANIRLRITIVHARSSRRCPRLEDAGERCDLCDMLTTFPRALWLSACLAASSLPLGCSVGFVDDLSDGVAGDAGASGNGNGGRAAAAGTSGQAGASGQLGLAGRAGFGGKSGAAGLGGAGAAPAGGSAGASGVAGNASAGTGGTSLGGSGGGVAGSGQASGAGGSVAGGGGVAGTGGTTAGAGGSVAGAGGSTAGTGGSTAGTGGSPTCSEDDLSCSGDVRQGCQGGTLVDLEVCSPGLCTPNRCLQCAPGSAPSCEGQMPVTCVNGERIPSAPCETGQTCSDGVCQAACSAGSFRCTGALLQRCKGGGYDDVETCGRAALCNAPAARCDACETSETRCQAGGEIFETCNGGSWSFAESCKAGCIAGTGCIAKLGPLSAGNQKTCVLADRRPICWGGTSHGELGQVASASGPHELPLSDVSAVAIGRAHVCVLRSVVVGLPGEVLCAGADDQGQLGRGSVGPDSLAFLRVDGLPDGIVKVMAIGDTSCALDIDGGAWCWGRLIESNQALPVKINPIGGDVAIMAIGGDDHALFASSVGGGASLRSFGRNDTRQLGYFTPSSPTAFPGADVMVGAGLRLVVAGGTVTASSRGLGHSCAIDAGDQLYCWGLSDDGQTGVPVTTTLDLGVDGLHQIADGPQFVAGQVAEVSAGPRHTCIRRTNAGASCFGHNGDGRTGPFSSTSAPLPLPGEILGIAAGDDHSCALVGDPGRTRVWCWGANDRGQTTANQPVDPNPREVVLVLP